MSWIKVVLAAGVVWALGGCDDKCDQDEVDRAELFLRAHQSCTTDDDCTTVSDFCGAIPGGFCGQLVMNREGAESSEWDEIERTISECAPESCEVCAAAVVLQCRAGVCGGP